MENISIKGLVIALIVAVALDLVGGMLAIPLFATEFTEEGIDLLFQQNNVLLYALAVGTFSTFIGGLICAKFGDLAPVKNAMIFSAIGVVSSLAMATYDPAWLDIVGCLLIIPAAILGAKIGIKKPSLA